MPTLSFDVKKAFYGALSDLVSTAEQAAAGDAEAIVRLKAALMTANHVCEHADRTRTRKEEAKRWSFMRRTGGSVAGLDAFARPPVDSSSEALANAINLYPSWRGVSDDDRRLVTTYIISASSDGAIEDEDTSPTNRPVVQASETPAQTADCVKAPHRHL